MRDGTHQALQSMSSCDMATMGCPCGFAITDPGRRQLATRQQTQ